MVLGAAQGAAQGSVVCYNCGQPGHIRRNCPALRGGHNARGRGGRANMLNFMGDSISVDQFNEMLNIGESEEQ